MGRTRRGTGFTAAAIAGAVLLAGCVLGETGDPHVVTDTSAVLHGTLATSASGDVSYDFEWGPTTDYGASFGSSAHVDTGSRTDVSHTMSGLTAGTTYHYRLCFDVATDTQPRGCSVDRTVTTGVGRVSVTGIGRITSSTNPPFDQSETNYWVDAAADPSGSGYIDGTVTMEQKYTFKNNVVFDSYVTYPVLCLRVEGNVATVGYHAGLLAIEDADSSGNDPFVPGSATSDGSCPEPSTSLLGPPPHLLGDFTVDGGS